MNYFKKWYYEILKRFTFWEIWNSSKIQEKYIFLIPEIAANVNNLQKEAVQAWNNFYWLDVAHAFTSNPKL